MSMQVVEISISRLKHDPNQARIHGERNLEAIKQSLEKFGQQHPIVVGKGNVILAGNGRVEAARALGWKKIKAVRTKLGGSDATAFAIADNRTAELADWDDKYLLKLVGELEGATDFSLDDIGFDDKEIKALAAAMGSDDGLPDLPDNDNYKEQYGVIVMCSDESQQKNVYDTLSADGYDCKVVTT